MTRDEKLAQLSAVWGYEVLSGTEPDFGQLRALAADGLGEITRLSGSTNLHPMDVAVAANAIQRFLVEETRLGIPAIIHEECLHGLLALGAPSFQQSIGAAATFDPDLVLEMAADDQAAHARDGCAPCPRARSRHHPGSALGPGRGDVR